MESTDGRPWCVASRTAHSIARKTPAPSPVPVQLRTCTATMVAFFATPHYWPAALLAQCVPCELHVDDEESMTP